MAGEQGRTAGATAPVGAVASPPERVSAEQRLQSTQDRAQEILSQQKDKAEEVKNTAVELVKADQYQETKALYERRLQELSSARRALKTDKSLSAGGKSTVDAALAVEQDGIRLVLTEYARLFGK